MSLYTPHPTLKDKCNSTCLQDNNNPYDQVDEDGLPRHWIDCIDDSDVQPDENNEYCLAVCTDTLRSCFVYQRPQAGYHLIVYTIDAEIFPFKDKNEIKNYFERFTSNPHRIKQLPGFMMKNYK